MTAPELKFKEMHEKCQKDVHRAVVNTLSKSAAIHNAVVDADDIVQDVWVKAWTALESGQEIDSHWLSVVAVNTAKNYRRNTQARANTVIRSTDEPVIGDDGTETSFLDTFLGGDNRKVLDERPSQLIKALGAVPSSTLEILVMHFVQEMTMTQIASRLGISLAAAQKRYQRALAFVMAKAERNSDKVAA